MKKIVTHSSVEAPLEHQIIRSTCAYCGVGCGVDINLEKGFPKTVSGTPEHPANYGRLCVKGTHLLDTIDLDGRLLSPEINNKKVKWHQAIEHVANHFSHIISKHGRDSVAFYVSGQLLTEDYYVANKLMKGYIGSANIDTNSRLCMSSAVSAYKRAFGEDIVPCEYSDIEETNLLILIGSNAAWTHPVLFQRIERARQLNPDFTLVVIDPRTSTTASSADLHLNIKPGTDAALFNGLFTYLVEHNHVDNEYITRATEGFEECKSECKKWEIDAVAQFCDLSIESITKFYQCFAKSERAVSFYSMGINQSTSGVDKCNAIINVHLITNKIASTGNGPFSITGQPNAMGGREVGGLANQLCAHLDIENHEHQSLLQEYWNSPRIAKREGAKAVDMFDQVLSGKIKAIWIMATNPLVSLPDNNKIIAAMKRCEFVVVSDCVANNDTLAYADVKLPATPWLEKSGTVTNSERRISRQRQAVKAAGEAKPDWQIISLIAKKMGYRGFDYTHPHQIFTEFAALSGYKNVGNTKRIFNISGLKNLSMVEYENFSPTTWPVLKNSKSYQRPFVDGIFNTHSGKAKIVSIEPKLPTQKTSVKYPFILNSGRYRDHWHSMTRTGKSARFSQHLSKPFIELNIEVAKALNLNKADLVEVRSEVGCIVLPVLPSTSVHKKQCFAPIHWNREFASDAVISRLFYGKVDPLSGQPELKHVGVALKKAEFDSFVDVYCIEKQSLTADYYLHNRTKFGWHQQFAFHETIITENLLCEFSLNGEWLSFSKGNETQLMCLDEGRLSCVVYIRSDRFSAPGWVGNLFSHSSLNVSEIQSLLYDKPISLEKGTQNVCSCFNVSKQEIEHEVINGTVTLSALAEKLNCGTNCGSCKPEIQAIIDESMSKINQENANLINRDKTIPVVELDLV